MSSKYPNSGTLNKNDDKKTPNSPDYRGKAEINGVEWWMSAWIKEGNNGRKFMSISFSPPRDRSPAPAPAAEQSPGPQDDVPF